MPTSPTTLDSVGLPLGSLAGDFELRGVDGKTHALRSFSDKKVLVVIFSCNHCPYVQAYEDRMVQLQKDYSAKGVTLVAINSNDDAGYLEDSYPNMIKRAKERGFNFPYLRDDTQEIAKKYGAICTPHVFAFDQQRRLQYKGRIDDNRNFELVKTKDLRDALDAILAGHKPSVQVTRPFGCSVKWKN